MGVQKEGLALPCAPYTLSPATFYTPTQAQHLLRLHHVRNSTHTASIQDLHILATCNALNKQSYSLHSLALGV